MPPVMRKLVDVATAIGLTAAVVFVIIFTNSFLTARGGSVHGFNTWYTFILRPDIAMFGENPSMLDCKLVGDKSRWQPSPISGSGRGRHFEASATCRFSRLRLPATWPWQTPYLISER